jgi:Flavodoxin
MSKIAVVYYTKHGSTGQYAKWVADAVGADLFKQQECSIKDLQDYDVIVYGGGIYSGGIKGLEFIKKNWKRFFVNKKVIVFAVGITIDMEENRKQCREINFVKKLEGLPCYFFPGAYDPAEIKGVDSKIIGFTKKLISDSTPMGKQLLDYFDNGCDMIDRNRIDPLVEELKSL